jgi:hypothetical protein
MVKFNAGKIEECDVLKAKSEIRNQWLNYRKEVNMEMNTE